MQQQTHSLQLYQNVSLHDQHHILKPSNFPSGQYSSPQPLDPFADNTSLFSLNPEVFFVAFLLFALPILIYLAYRHGKKMGRKEHSPSAYRYFGEGGIERRSSEDSTSDNSFPQREGNQSKVSSSNSSPGLAHSLSQQPVKNKGQISPPLSLHSKRGESAVQTEDEMVEDLVLNQESVEKEKKEARVMPIEFKNDFAVSGNNGQLNIAYVQTWDPKVDEGSKERLFEEKLKLHSEYGQILKKELKYGVIFTKHGDSFQKTEIEELRTTYNPSADAPLMNAELLKGVYQDASTSQRLFGLVSEQSEGKKKPSAPLAICSEEVKQNERIKSAAQSLSCLDVPRKLEKQMSAPTDLKPLEDKKKPEQEYKIEAIVEKYGVPDETGKFNKIFKDVQWIGKGSFGEVCKVSHRLDGKLYAVKKVKLKLGRFEDLKKESKVFREVFAMTDLHHHNIVRYSTCWVEIEWDKDNQESIEKLDKPRLLSEPVNLEDISEKESYNDDESRSESDNQSESESDSSPVDYSRNSELGFEWDVSSGKEKETPKKEKKKNKEEKKTKETVKKTGLEGRLQIKKKTSDIRLKSLSRSFVDDEIEEASRASSISRIESISEIPGCRLCLYIQMEYCEGQSLKDYLENSKNKIERKKALQMFKKLVEGVQAIHKSGILHRDLKPANIFLDGSEDIKIGDFGLALLDKFDDHGEVLTPKEISRKGRRLHSQKVGTPMYTSPEQESGGHYDQKTDIYSLGLIFYEMLMRFETHHERYQHFGRIRNKNEVAGPFKKNFVEEAKIILKMTANLPEDRPTSEQVVMDIDRLLENLRLSEEK